MRRKRFSAACGAVGEKPGWGPIGAPALDGRRCSGQFGYGRHVLFQVAVDRVIELVVVIVFGVGFRVGPYLLIQHLPAPDILQSERAGTQACQHHIAQVGLDIVDRADHRVAGHVREDPDATGETC